MKKKTTKKIPKKVVNAYIGRIAKHYSYETPFMNSIKPKDDPTRFGVHF